MEKQILIEDKYSGSLYYLVGVQQVSGTKRSTVTQYPTASGKKISDNAFVEPQTLSFSLITSHLAMTPQKILRKDSKELEELTIKQLKQIISDWQDNAIRLNITTFEGYYTNMVLSTVQTTEGDNLGVWQPSLSFTEVREATVEFVQLDFPADAEEKANSNEEQPLGDDIGISAGDVGEAAGGALGGALIGAAIGSFFPGPGTAVGAVVGGIIGSVVAIVR
jgi:hypothetical protein